MHMDGVLPFCRSIEAELEPYWLGCLHVRSVLLVSAMIDSAAIDFVPTYRVISPSFLFVHVRRPVRKDDARTEGFDFGHGTDVRSGARRLRRPKFIHLKRFGQCSKCVNSMTRVPFLNRPSARLPMNGRGCRTHHHLNMRSVRAHCLARCTAQR